MSKKLLFCFIFLFLYTLSSCAQNDIPLQIKSKYNSFIDKKDENIQIWYYNCNQEFKRIIVSFNQENKSNPELHYLNKTLWLESKSKNSEITIKMFVINDYQSYSIEIFNGNKQLVSNNKYILSEEELIKLADIEKRKKGVYFEDFYILPFLGEKYFRYLKLENNNSLFIGHNIKISKWKSSGIFPQTGLDVKITINPEYIVEKYKDQYGNFVVRIIEKTSNIDFNDLSSIEKYTKEIPDKYGDILKTF